MQVAVTSPTPATRVAGSDITCTATAIADSPATIVSVQFLANGAPIATDPSAPYSATIPAPVPGTYSITAVATDSNGARLASAPVVLSLLGLRTDFPEFASTTVFPDSKVNLWLGIAAQMVNMSRWGDMYSLGVELFAAHNLALDLRNSKAAATGGAAGGSGIASSKSVDKVSISYDTSLGLEEGAGQFGLTSYGNRLLYFMRLFGAGGFQL